MNNPKILIGCVTHEKHSPLLDKFLKSLDEINYKNKDILFVDNSEGKNYFELLKEKGFNVLKESARFNVLKDNPKENRILNIISGRNIIREYFLDKNYDYLFFLDTDVIVPKDIFQKLLECNADIATGVYLCNQQIKDKRIILPAIYKFHDEGKVKIPPIEEMTGEKIFEIAVCGMGCCLIKRDVLNKIKFRQFTSSTEDGEDVAFCIDARKNGFKVKVNTAAKCKHIVKLNNEYKTLEI